MRNSIFKIALFITGIGVIGCGTSRHLNPGVDKEELWEYGTVRSFTVHPEVPSDTARVSIQYTIPASGSGLKQLTDSLILSNLGVIDTMNVDHQVFRQYGDEFLREYTFFVSGDSSHTFPWSLNIEIDFCYIGSQYVKADFSTEVYMGGAHGNTKFMHYMIDAGTNSLLTVEDICSDVPELEKRAEVYFRRLYSIDPGADLSAHQFWFQDNAFHLNQNFYFDTETVTFVFNQYEIAPYFMGAFYVELPLSELEDILRLKK